MPDLSDLEFQLFRKYIEEKCGISIGDGKAYLIQTRLSKLLADSGMRSFNELYDIIIKNNNPQISEKVIDAITTNETLWFRDKTPWTILEEILLPYYILQLRDNKKHKIRLWSAASSTGQEIYSIAMCIDRYLEKNLIKDITLSNFELIATDISSAVIDIAKRGRYDAISIMRGMDPIYKEKYFTKEGVVWQLSEKIKNAVSFKQFNLQNSFSLLGRFDIIFCRYVLIYFADKLKIEIFKKFYDCIENDGALFIGSSELYTDIGNYFNINHHLNGTYYRRRADAK